MLGTQTDLFFGEEITTGTSFLVFSFWCQQFGRQEFYASLPRRYDMVKQST